MKKRISVFIFVSVLLVMLLPLTVSARNCENVTLSQVTTWDDGSLKSMNVTFDWGAAGNEHLYVVVFDEHEESDGENDEYWYQYSEYTHTDTESIEASIEDFAQYRDIEWYAYGGDGSTPSDGMNTITVSFEKGKIPLSVNKNYSFVMFNAPDGDDYRPTDPLGTLACSSGELEFTDSNGTPETVDVDETHTHSVNTLNGSKARCGVDGFKTAYYCTGCNTYFEDEACENAIGTEDEYESWKTGNGKNPALTHNFVDGRCTNCHDFDPKYALSEGEVKKYVKHVFGEGEKTFDVTGNDEFVYVDGEKYSMFGEFRYYRIGDTVYAVHGGYDHVVYFTIELKKDKPVKLLKNDTMTEEPVEEYLLSGNGGAENGKKGGSLIWLWIILILLLILLIIYIVVFFIWKKKEELPDALAFLGFLEPSYKAINKALFSKKEE